MPLLRRSRFFLSLILLLTIAMPSKAEGPLVLIAEFYNDVVTERLPIVAKLTIKNSGDEAVAIRFTNRDVAHVVRYSSLVLSNQEREYRIANVSGIRGTMTAMPPIFPLEPGATITLDRLMLPLAPEPPRRRAFKNRMDRYSFVPPGSYSARFDVDAGTGEILSSNEVELRIAEAKGTNAHARDMLKKEHVGFIEGNDAPPSEEHYKSGGFWKKVDVSRFPEIQKIADEFPESQYAEWIRFWKVYHHGDVDEGIEYAHAHRDFPLVDNLILHKVEGLTLSASKYDQDKLIKAERLLEELHREFPDSDCRAQSAELMKRVRVKRGE